MYNGDSKTQTPAQNKFGSYMKKTYCSVLPPSSFLICLGQYYTQTHSYIFTGIMQHIYTYTLAHLALAYASSATSSPLIKGPIRNPEMSLTNYSVMLYKIPADQTSFLKFLAQHTHIFETTCFIQPKKLNIFLLTCLV